MASAGVSAPTVTNILQKRFAQHDLHRSTPDRQKLLCRSSKNAQPDSEGPAKKKLPDFREKAEKDKAVGRRSMIQWGALSAAGTSCACCFSAPDLAKAGEWGYEYENGPISWGGTCSAGLGQSPIDIRAVRSPNPGLQKQLSFQYRTVENAQILNTGHGTMQVNFAPGQYAYFMDREFELVQFHFHTPSEHSISGIRTAMEVHLVHKDRRTGGLAVLGALMAVTNCPNPVLATSLAEAPKAGGELTDLKAPINVMNLIPMRGEDGRRPFVHYIGSLTTPPCSEGVDWFLFKDPICVTADQVLQFEAFLTGGKSLGMNSRPPQDIKQRLYMFDA